MPQLRTTLTAHAALTNKSQLLMDQMEPMEPTEPMEPMEPTVPQMEPNPVTTLKVALMEPATVQTKHVLVPTSHQAMVPTRPLLLFATALVLTQPSAQLLLNPGNALDAKM